MPKFENLSSYQVDVLKEIGNIGSGNAATSLSKLLNCTVEMNVPAVRVLSFSDTIDLVGGPDEIIVSIFLRIQGEAPGSMFFVLSPEQAELLIHQITGDKTFSFLNIPSDELALSALHEIGNILSGSYLSALSDFTSINMQSSVPSLNMDMAGAILSQGLLENSKESDYALTIDTTILDKDSSKKAIQVHFFLLPDPQSFHKIFSALGVKEQWM